MSSQKLIVVVGATGNQGGSVVNTFLQEPDWRIRGITRNPASASASSLASRGVEVVQADLDEPGSLTAAFQDAHAIFAITDFWAIYRNPDAAKDEFKPKPGQQLNDWAKGRETSQLKNIIDAAAKVPSLERFVVSSMPNVTRLSGGKYTHVCHFDSKADAVDYEKETYPDLWAKTSEYKPGFFLSNFVGDPAGRPIKRDDGTYQFSYWADLDLKLPWIAHDEDTGPFVKALVNDSPGKNLVAYREWLTIREIAETFSKATGFKTEAVQLPLGELWFPCPPDLKQEFEEHFAFANEFGYEGRNDVGIVHPKDLKSPPVLETVVDNFKKQDWVRIYES